MRPVATSSHQDQMILVNTLHPESAVHNVPTFRLVRGHLSVPRSQASLTAMLNRPNMLAAGAPAQGRQLVLPQVDVCDLRTSWSLRRLATSTFVRTQARGPPSKEGGRHTCRETRASIVWFQFGR